jgi:hypothetical protein
MKRACVALLLAACTPSRNTSASAASASTTTTTSTSTSTSTSAVAAPSASPARGTVEFVAYSAKEALDSFVMKELTRADKDRKKLLIYVGAPWCEPCVRFHEAAGRGELDRVFPDLRLIDLDRDRDENELRQTSCLSPMIPMFAKPTPRGNCSEKMIHGGIKGDGAVDHIVPRLEKLLAQ